MNLQPLYDIKERLEYTAIAGVGLLGEDFRLRRAAEELKPLAAASPVFAKIDSGLQQLLSAPAEQRAGLLLDVLALADAVAYTQAKTGVEGELEPLPTGGGVYRQIPYGQISPILTALTTTGSGRVEIVKSAWETNPEFFSDFRVLPAVIAGLGDSYGEMAELNASILKGIGPSVLPLLKQGFDPEGKKGMVRRVEVLSAMEGAAATPWLREILPQAKKDVRVAVILALGDDPGNTALLLDLSKSERSGGNREAALRGLAKQDGDAVREFWTAELKKNSGSVRFLQDTDGAWAAELLASGLREQLEGMLAKGGRVSEEEQRELSSWCQAVGKKDSPVMLDFWRWAEGHMETFDGFTNEKGKAAFVGVRLTDTLRDCMRLTGPGPLRDFCLGLWDRRPAMTRYLSISFQAALLSCPAAEVYEKYAPCILTEKPLVDKARKETLNNVLLRALGDVYWHNMRGCHVIAGQATAEPLDPRWVERLIHAVCKPNMGRFCPFVGADDVDGFDKKLVELANRTDPEQCAKLVPYLRQRMAETGGWNSYSHYLLMMGGSPKGLLGGAMKKGKPAYIYYVWVLLDKAAKALPAGEVAELCQEVLDAKWIRPVGRELALAELALPWTIEQLRAGKPFPEWNDWNQMRP